MAARSNTLSARTRAIFRELDGAYEDYRVSMLGLASLWDQLDLAPKDRMAAHDRWWQLHRELSARIADDARKEQAWASKRLNAV